MKVTSEHLQALVDAGFIAIAASKPLAKPEQSASKPLARAGARAGAPAGVEGEAEEEKEPRPLSRGEREPDADIDFTGPEPGAEDNGPGFKTPDLLKDIAG
jgi:hypothetical protein